jgi:DNA-binding NarL/FixJ family response regulator
MKKFRILVVDDHPQFLNAMRFLLMDGFEDKIESIDIATNGKECLEFLEQRIYDVIFMDIDMPILNGIETTKKATDIYRDLNIVALSFHSDMKYIVKMIEAGAKSYIIKEEINKNTINNVLQAS